MAVCRATKANGEPCTLPANGPQGLCWGHNPANCEKRRKMASRAARSKPSKELARIKQRLSDLASDVLDGSVERGVAAVASQVLNVYLRAIELERKVKEQEEILERIESLEQSAEAKGGSRWGA